MPDYVVHFTFGESLLSASGLQAVVADEAALSAWRWGLQGPDPLFFQRSTSSAGTAMHRGAPEGMIQAMLLYLEGLPRGPRDTAGAWLCGLLGHYFLDRTAHPYVGARTQELSQRMPGVTGSACHHIIETDMDADLYLYVHKKPLSAFDPDCGMRLLPWQKEAIAGMLSAGAAAKGKALSTQAARRALNVTVIAERLLFRGGRPLRIAARGAELALGKDRQLTSLIKGKRPRWDSLNLGHAPWTDPRDGTIRTQSVPELMEQARQEALPALERLSQMISQGERGALDLGGLDFSGRQ